MLFLMQNISPCAGGFGGRSDSDSEETESNFGGRNRRGANNPRKGFFARQAASSEGENADTSTADNERAPGSPEFGGFPPSSDGERPSFGGMPEMGQFSGTSQLNLSTLILYGVCLMVIIAALFVLKMIKRRR